MKFVVIIVLFCGLFQPAFAFDFSWEIDETPEGAESATVVEPVQVVILGEVVAVPSHSASLALMRKYSVHLGPEWSEGHAYRLLQTFESIPQLTNNSYEESPILDASVWRLSNRHLLNDIEIEYRGEERIVTVSEAAFVHATPLLAEIGGVRGRYFSKRLHRAVVRFDILDESKFDLNSDGEVNILDLVLVAQALGESDSEADVNGDGVVNILDLVQIVNHI